MNSKEIPPSALAEIPNKDVPPTVQLAGALQGSRRQIDQLAKQVVEVADAFPGVSGARLWYLDARGPKLWQQSGHIPVPAADPFSEEKISAGQATTEPSGRWICPLSRNDEVLGILEVCGCGTLSVDAQALLEKFAGIVIEALGHKAEEQAAQDLAEILEATKLLNSTLDLPELLDIILQLCTRLCAADRGTVFLVDRGHGQIWSLKGLGLDKHEIRLPIKRGIAGWVARHGEVVRVEDASGDPRFDPTVDRDLGYHTQELLALPIRDKGGEIIGVLELLNKRTGPFLAADEKSLSHLSIHLALALGNAQLHREIVAKQRLETDLALARNVQRGLLPEKLPELDGFELAVAYRPSLMVGGDYYDFMRLKPQSLLAVIADVEGKGVASALTMANLHASLHSLATHVHALEHVVRSVNDTLLRDTRAHKLLSMFVAVIDERRRALHYINAGHVPPVVIRDGAELRLDQGGLLLGVLPDAEYRRGRFDLYPGDILAAYTDGVTEAMNVHREEYGIRRLVDVIRARKCESAARIVETVLSEVDQYSADGPEGDDRVMLICKVS